MFLSCPVGLHVQNQFQILFIMFFVADDSIWKLQSSSFDAFKTGNYTINRHIFWHGVISSMCTCKQELYFAANFDGKFDLYKINIFGGDPVRLTYFGANFMQVVACKKEGVIIISNHEDGVGEMSAYRIDGTLILNNVQWMHEDVVQRYGYGYSKWQGYKGGAVGQIWKQQNNQWIKHTDSQFNCVRPLKLLDKIFYLSDEPTNFTSGFGNIFCDGKPVTKHSDFYVHDVSVFEDKLLYGKGGELFVYDVKTESSKHLDIQFNMHANQCMVRLNAHSDEFRHTISDSLCDFALNENGKELALTIRGQIFTMPLHMINASKFNESNNSHLIAYMNDMLVVTKVGLEEKIIVYDKDKNIKQIYENISSDVSFAHIVSIRTCKDKIAITNSRDEIIVLDNGSVQVIKNAGQYEGATCDWSPGGRYLLYSMCADNTSSSKIMIYDTLNKTNHLISNELNDHGAVFSACGKFIYFISNRSLVTEYDQVHFQLNFNQTMNLYVVCLDPKTMNPFKPWLQKNNERDNEKNDEKDNKEHEIDQIDNNKDNNKLEEEKDDNKDKHIKDPDYDFTNIDKRCFAFPLEMGLYSHIIAYKNGLMFCKEDKKKAFSIDKFDFNTFKTENLFENVEGWALSGDKNNIVIMKNGSLQVFEAGKNEDNSLALWKQGPINWDRISLYINQKEEFVIIYDQAFSFIKEQFCSPEQINYDQIYHKYKQLLPKITSRRELNFIISQMQGEFRTSHSYVIDHGDIRSNKDNKQGYLGAKFTHVKNGYRIDHILSSKSWSDRETECSPLIDCEKGQIITAVDGKQLNNINLSQALYGTLNQHYVTLKIIEKDGTEKFVHVKPIRTESVLYYQEFVDNARARVEQTDIGYIHISDMNKDGYREFCRQYFKQYHKRALIIDLRYNGGGHVSPMILKILATKSTGTVRTKYGVVKEPYHAAPDKLVFLCNERTGSDGDIICHNIKQMKLGPLVGRRTWGGVVGILIRNAFIDGGMASQPEYVIEFNSGEKIENKGVDPDIIVENKLGDSFDYQLQKAIELANE